MIPCILMTINDTLTFEFVSFSLPNFHTGGDADSAILDGGEKRRSSADAQAVLGDVGGLVGVRGHGLSHGKRRCHGQQQQRRHGHEPTSVDWQRISTESFPPKQRTNSRNPRTDAVDGEKIILFSYQRAKCFFFYF